MPPPVVSATAQHIYDRAPEVYRTLDIDHGWPLLRYLDAVTGALEDLEVLADRILGSRPVGPAAPVPWGVPDDELVAWQAARESALSALGDPLTADAAWLPWLASLVGAVLAPSATEAEQRDTIRYATSGWRAGTRGAIGDAARSALTGTRYARVLAHTTVIGANPAPGTAWDITIITRTSETPDPGAVLGAVERKGVKPAGVTLHHVAYSATWTAVHAAHPVWGKTWLEIQEAGL